MTPQGLLICLHFVLIATERPLQQHFARSLEKASLRDEIAAVKERSPWPASACPAEFQRDRARAAIDVTASVTAGNGSFTEAPGTMKLALLALLAAIALAESGEAVAADKVRYANGWLPNGDKAIPYYAKVKGYFAAQGLDVTFQSSRGSTESITKVGTGAADVGSAALGALLQARANSNVPVKAIFSFYNIQPDAILTTDKSGLRSFKDLEGKTIATGTFAASNVYWPLVLQAAGVNPEKIKLLKVDPNALAPMLVAGRVDGVIAWTTAKPAFDQPLRGSGKALKVLPWSDVGFIGYGHSVIASDRFLTTRPNVARRFAKAMHEATIAAVKDPKGVAAAVKQLYPQVNAAVVEAEFRATIPLVDNAISRSEGIGTFDGRRLADTWKWVARSQGWPVNKFDPERAVSRVPVR